MERGMQGERQPWKGKMSGELLFKHCLQRNPVQSSSTERLQGKQCSWLVVLVPLLNHQRPGNADLQVRSSHSISNWNRETQTIKIPFLPETVSFPAIANK